MTFLPVRDGGYAYLTPALHKPFGCGVEESQPSVPGFFRCIFTSTEKAMSTQSAHFNALSPIIDHILVHYNALAIDLLGPRNSPSKCSLMAPGKIFRVPTRRAILSTIGILG